MWVLSVDPACPAWWRERTELFGRMLSSPLTVSHGTFRSIPEARTRALIESVVERPPGAAARVSLYHEQVWKRLFVTLQECFRRTERLLGAHHFNRVATVVLTHARPTSRDLAEIAVPFCGAVEAGLVGASPEANARPWLRELRAMLAETAVPMPALRTGLRLDEAERRAFRAPLVPAVVERGWSGRPDARARIAPSFSLLRVEHDVIDVVRVRAGHAAPLRVPLHVTVAATTAGVAVRLVDPVYARLLALASERPLGEAMARTRSALDAKLATRFDAQRDDYVRESFERGYWTALGPSV